MRIAITQRVVENQSYPETRDALAADWPAWLGAAVAGAVVLPIPNRAGSANDWWSEIQPDALVLSGGNDWGKAPARDETERLLLDRARAAGAPVFAVCRGLHVVNVCLGGKIVPDLADRTSVSHVIQDHPVDLDSSPVAALGNARSIMVNSYHAQGVALDAVAPGFHVFATAEGGFVEGMFHESEAILAVQWHPERPSPSAAFDKELLQKLLARGAFWTGAGP